MLEWIGSKMNERIKELAREAGYLPDMFGIGHWDMPECKKFAELIVREGASVGYDASYYECALNVSNKIKEHFGVEK